MTDTPAELEIARDGGLAVVKISYTVTGCISIATPSISDHVAARLAASPISREIAPAQDLGVVDTEKWLAGLFAVPVRILRHAAVQTIDCVQMPGPNIRE
jgi:hypothetical protein